ncbi:hypothetical protein AAG570_003797 [Ranatra chinensis]|uniref:Uncharacterized protein n=1 Tax=Ranatra chinensis TaxID=642074 RepID=A0ABD0YJ26_9HEMI
MGKSGYKKFLKKEKAKVKLKGSKALLPKGQNVTDTNFKVKKIVIKDQIKLHQPGEILSSRKLNLKELLSRLSHHNVSMKLEALEGLLELITKHTDVVLVHNLIEVTHKVSELTIDGFSSVRKEANKVLNSIFTTVRYFYYDF